jgi:hypothetical protein
MKINFIMNQTKFTNFQRRGALNCVHNIIVVTEETGVTACVKVRIQHDAM